jgi:hypothetical protein
LTGRSISRICRIRLNVGCPRVELLVFGQRDFAAAVLRH